MNTDASGRCVDQLVMGNLKNGTSCKDNSLLYSIDVNQIYSEADRYQLSSEPCCGPDSTQWLHKEIKNHWEYALTNPDLWITPQDTYLLGLSILDEAFRLMIYGLAVDYGYVDYRMLARISRTTDGLVPSDTEYSCSNSGVISVCGRCQNSTDFGNFILGIAIHAAGFSKFVAEQAGEIFNRLSGDTSASADNQGVVKGFEYSEGGLVSSNYDRDIFCRSLSQMGTAWHDTIPPSGCSTPCTKQNLDHAPHSWPNWNILVSRSTGSNKNRYDSPHDWFNDLIAKALGIRRQ